MKLKILIVLSILTIASMGCNSDGRAGGANDSLMTDGEVIDTATSGTGIPDTGMIDTLQADTSTRSKTQPIR